jgi:endonuclease-8
MLCYYFARNSDSNLLLALAYSGCMLNLFNLIPISPLDGGRITAIISPKVWLAGVPLLAGLFFYHPSPMLILIAVLAYPQLKEAIWGDPAKGADYYTVPRDTHQLRRAVSVPGGVPGHDELQHSRDAGRLGEVTYSAGAAARPHWRPASSGGRPCRKDHPSLFCVNRPQALPAAPSRTPAAAAGYRFRRPCWPADCGAAQLGQAFPDQLPPLALRIHLLMFGTYRINERKDAQPRLSLGFDDGEEFNFYTCSVKTIDADLDAQYDWSADVMNDQWNPAQALKKLRAAPDMLVCDALLDQEIFSGVGNIIKNEVLFRIRVHPLSRVGALPAAKLRELVAQARAYSFDFLKWKRALVLKQHWLAHTKRICPRCDIPFHKAHLGKTNRRSFLYALPEAVSRRAYTSPVSSTQRSQRTPPAS